MRYDFAERLEFSQGQMIETDKQLIQRAIPGCISVRKTPPEQDKKGIDYVALLRCGAEIGIDVKTRDKGASRYWKNREAEVALEIWSVCPSFGNRGKAGWTLSESSNVDLILYKFDVTDSPTAYMFPFQLLRMAFRKNGRDWIKRYSRKKQYSKGWSSEAVFVPVSEVKRAIDAEMDINTFELLKGGNTA